MTKTAIVHAQQMWEYMTLSRKTQNYLAVELNELGLVGWELVTIDYHKDIKGVGEAWVWTAFLRRARAAPPSTQTEAQKAAEDPTEKYRQGKIEVGDLHDDFNVRPEDAK